MNQIPCLHNRPDRQSAPARWGSHGGLLSLGVAAALVVSSLIRCTTGSIAGKESTGTGSEVVAFRGKVISETGTAMAKVAVQVSSADSRSGIDDGVRWSRILAESVTDDGGKYSISCTLSTGEAVAAVEAFDVVRGFSAFSEVETAMAVDGTVDMNDLVLRLSGLVTGTIALAGMPRDGIVILADPLRSVAPDSDGRFAIELPSGQPYEIIIADTLAPGRGTLVFTTDTLSPRSVIDCGFLFFEADTGLIRSEQALVMGVIEPVLENTPYYIQVDGDREIRSTGENGEFQFPCPSGSFLLSIFSNLESTPMLISVDSVEPGDTIDLGAVEFGAPWLTEFAHVSGTLTPAPSIAFQYAVLISDMVTLVPDTTGWFEADLPPGPHVLTVINRNDPDQFSNEIWFDLEPSQTLDLGEIRIP